MHIKLYVLIQFSVLDVFMNFIEFVYIDINRSFVCIKFRKVLLRKSYIGSEVAHFWSKN